MIKLMENALKIRGIYNEQWGIRNSCQVRAAPLTRRPMCEELLSGGGVAGTTAVLRHLSANLGAAATGLSALPHHVVSIGQTFAVFSAAVAYFGAGRTYSTMQLRVTQHEIRGGLAYLRTVEQQSNVFAASVIAAFVQTVRHRLEANVVAIGHDFDVLIGLVSHDDTSSFLEYAQNTCRSRDGKT
jgi:hypothetical protein